MSTTLRFESPSIPSSSSLRVIAMRGEEALSRPFRFEIELCSSDPALPLDDIIGRPAALHIGGRRVAGVVAELEQGAAEREGFRYRAVLVPRLWLLSLATKSRVFRDLSLPQIAAAVAASAHIDVELRLTGTYPVRRFVAQYRESDLAFLSRLLEAEGIAHHMRGDVLILSDHNEAFDERLGVDESAVAIDTWTCTRRMAPRTLLLHDVDPAADEPLEAQSAVDHRGFGMQIEDGVALSTPEHGHGVARRRAEALAAEVTRYHGQTGHAVSPGTRIALDGHFRPDFNRDYLVVSATHALAGDSVTTALSAITADTTYRPPLATPKPRIDGVMRAVVDGQGDEGRYSVALPFDLGGHAGRGSEPLPVVSPEEGMRFTLRKGTSVVLGFVDGDPDRPLIAGAVPRDTRARTRKDKHVIRTPQGAIIEMSGSFAQPARGETRSVDGVLAEMRALNGTTTLTAAGGDTQVSLSWTAVTGAASYQLLRGTTVVTTTTTALSFTDTMLTNGTVYSYTIKVFDADGAELATSTASATPHTDLASAQYGEESAGVNDWIRFAVPHGNGKWSYLRYGEQTTESVASSDETAGTFAEKTNVEGPFESKYFNANGEPPCDGDNLTSWAWSTLDDNAFNTNVDDGNHSRGNQSYFDHASSSGVFDYTDGNRTTITRGDHQSVTQGHRTDVILGDYRLVIPSRTNGVYDADTYWMRFRKSAGSWRKTERSHVSSDAITWGDTESLFLGFSLDGFFGTDLDLTIGADVDTFVGYKLDLGAGINCKVDFGHNFEWSFGKSFSNAKKFEVEAQKHITMRIPSDLVEKPVYSTWQKVGVGALAFLNVSLLAASTTTFAAAEPIGDAKFAVGGTLAGATTLAFAGALAALYLKKDRKVLDEEPSFEMNKDHIKLSIGDAILMLEKDCVAMSVKDSYVAVFADNINFDSKLTEVLQGDFSVYKGKFDVAKGPGTIANKAIQVQ